MACTHKHHGNLHTPGDTPWECSSNCAGRVTYCGPDPDDPFDPVRVCEHEDVLSAAGTSINIPSDSILHSLGPTGSWSSLERISGNPNGLFRLRRISDRYYDITPFHTQNIPCNPDQPGNVNVSETVTSSVKLNISVGAKIKEIIDIKVGFDISQTHTITCSVTLNGEKCRSVDFKFYVRYELWEMEIYPPDTVSRGKYYVRYFLPIGWKVRKEYVTPTCCTATSHSLYQRLEDHGSQHAELYSGNAYAAANALIRTRAELFDTKNHDSVALTMGEAMIATSLLDSKESDMLASFASDVRQLTDDFVGSAVAGATDISIETDDLSILPAILFEHLAEATDALKQARSSEDAKAAAAFYAKAHEQAQIAEHIRLNSFKGLDISSFKSLDLE